MDLRVIIFFQNKSVVQIILSYIRSVYLFDDVGPYHIETSTLILLCKSVDWFLYERDLRHERVKHNVSPNHRQILKVFLLEADSSMSL